MEGLLPEQHILRILNFIVRCTLKSYESVRGDSTYSLLARLAITLGRNIRENDNDRQWE